MLNELTDFDETIKERPAFLKTLCILTFIFSSFTIITNVGNVIDPQRAARMITISQKKATDSLNIKKAGAPDQNTNFSKKMMNVLANFSVDKIRWNALGNIISSVFCIVGAFLMWRLKKIGFAVYIVGIIAGIAIPFYLFGNNFIGVFMTAFAGFFGVLFIIFYAMNLKSMK